MARQLVLAFAVLGVCAVGDVAVAGPDDDDLAPPPREPAAGVAPDRPHQPDLYVAAGASLIPFGVIGGQLEVGHRVKSSIVWIRAHAGRFVDLAVHEDMAVPFNEVGLGPELRWCTWPGFLCSAIGTMAIATSAGGIAAIPYVDGELGIGQLALRFGIHGRIGDHRGAGASLGVVFRY